MFTSLICCLYIDNEIDPGQTICTAWTVGNILLAGGVLRRPYGQRNYRRPEASKYLFQSV